MKRLICALLTACLAACCGMVCNAEEAAPTTAEAQPDAAAVEEAPAASSETAAAGYEKDQVLVVSGSVVFEEKPYIRRGWYAYKCFKLNDGVNTWYIGADGPIYEYYKTAFSGRTITLECKYLEKASDGLDIIIPVNLIEGENKTPIETYLFDLNKGTPELPNFETFINFDEHAKHYCTASEDDLSMTIDTSPQNMTYTITGESEKAVGNGVVQRANEFLGLPDWLYEEMMQTRAIDGRQRETFGNIMVSWSFHPSTGLEAVYRVIS